MSTKVVAIIQARMGSTRLPGKVLLELAGRTMLGRVVRRVRLAGLVDEVVVATTNAPADDPIVDECRRLPVACFRGSEHDVVERYHRAAAAYRADVVVRITADCPLIDPEVTDHVIRAFLQHRPDYASNTLHRTYPRGLDTEVFTAAALARACHEASEPYQRTHVTPYIYQHPEYFRLLAVTRCEGLGIGREMTSRFRKGTVPFSLHENRDSPQVVFRPPLGASGEGPSASSLGPHPSALSDCRWTVDSREDLQFVRAVYCRMSSRRSDDAFSWRDVCRLLADEPSLSKLNRHVRQKQLVEG